MKKTLKYLNVAAAAALVIPAAAFAQYTGTSHPDDLPVTTSPEGVRQPLVYAARPAAMPAPVDPLAIPIAPAPGAMAQQVPRSYVAETHPADADGMVVGDPIPGGAIPAYARPVPPAPRALRAERNDDGVVTRVAGPANRLPEGMVVKTRMLQDLSTQTTLEGAEWRAELLEPLMRDGQVLIPAGSVMRGKVTEVHGGRRISGNASMHLTPLSVTMPDGTSLAMHAQVIDTDEFHSVKVDNEGTILRRDHKKEEAAVLALTTGTGAATGALIAGPPGALIGAGVGAGVSAAIWLKGDRQTGLPRGAEVTFELTRGITIGQEPMQ